MHIGSGCKTHMRESELPKGVLIVRVSGHLAAIIDGTIDHYGVIRWRGTVVEHFDHAVWKQPGWLDRMRQDAESVAACCRELEAKGLSSTAPLVLNSLVPDKGTPQEQES